MPYVFNIQQETTVAFIIMGNGEHGVKAMFLFIEKINYKLKKG